MITSAQFFDLMKNANPVLRQVYGDNYNDFDTEYTKVFQVLSSDGYQERDHTISGFGLVPEKPKGTAVQTDEANDGYNTTYTHLTYGLGFNVEREAIEDDAYRKIMGLPKALARSNRQTEETLAANHLNRAFNASYTGGDGSTLCSTTHTIYGKGGTWANRPANDVDLDHTSLEQALIDISKVKSDDGLKVRLNGKMLIVPKELEWTARKLLGSTLEPGSAQNDINPGQSIMPIHVMHYLTDVDAWFIQTDCPNGLLWFWRRRPEMTSDNHFETETVKFKTTWRASSGWSDPRCIYGTQGA